MVPCHIIAGTVDTTRGNLIFNWLLPGLFVMWGIKRSAAVSAETPATPVHA
jgi:hypothetical protein